METFENRIMARAKDTLGGDNPQPVVPKEAPEVVYYTMTEETAEHIIKLEAFFKAVAKLTANHDTLTSSDDGAEDEYAVVFPSKLGRELEKVDPKWYDYIQ